MINKNLFFSILFLTAIWIAGCQSDNGPADSEISPSEDAPSIESTVPAENTPAPTETASFAASPTSTAPPSVETESEPETKPYIEEKNIPFATVDGVELLLDLVKPAAGDGPFPVLVFIHGGGWNFGGRYEALRHSRLAAEAGYVATTVDYRLTSVLDEDSQAKYPFPAQIHDVKCAVRWLRANAEEHNIDPDRIGAIGHSSGGHLALMLALIDPADGLEGDCGDLNVSSSVQAAVILAGAADLERNFERIQGNDGRVMYSLLLGGTLEEKPEAYKLASPITYVSKDDPPIFSIMAENDAVISPDQAVILDAKMQEVGASHVFTIVEGRDHMYLRNPLPSIYEPIFAFFDQHLK